MFLSLYLKALDEELVALHTYMGTHKLAFTLDVEEHEEETQSPRPTEVGERDCTVRQVSRTFYGGSRSTVRVPNQSGTFTVKDWQLLQLNIQVCHPCHPTYVLVTDLRNFSRSPIRYALLKKHLHTSCSPNLCRSAS